MPQPFAFTPKVNALLATLYQSETISPQGYGAGVPISIVNGQYQINGGTWVSTPGTFDGGQTVAVRGTSSSSAQTTVTPNLTIGALSAGFAIKTTTTWSATDKVGSSAALTNGNLTLTKNAINSYRSRGTDGRSAGLLYLEFTFPISATGSILGAGILRDTAPLNSTFFGSTTAGLCVFDDFTYYNYNVTGAPANAVNCAGNGAVVGVALNLNIGQAWVKKGAGFYNANPAADPDTNVGGIDISAGGVGPWLPCVAFDTNLNQAMSCVINCGSSAFALTKPSLYTAFGA